MPRALHQEGTTSIDAALILFGLPGSQLIAAGEAAGLPTAREVFADRAYRADGTLLPRSEPGAVIHDTDRVLARVTFDILGPIPIAERFEGGLGIMADDIVAAIMAGLIIAVCSAVGLV